MYSEFSQKWEILKNLFWAVIVPVDSSVIQSQITDFWGFFCLKFLYSDLNNIHSLISIYLHFLPVTNGLSLTIYSVAFKNVVFICFHSLDAVVHDPENKTWRQKLRKLKTSRLGLIICKIFVNKVWVKKFRHSQKLKIV